MNKTPIHILYFTTDSSRFTDKIDHYFKLELNKLPDVKVHYVCGGEHVPHLLEKLEFTPDFIYLDDFDRIRRTHGLPTGLDQVNIPKGILFHDVHRSRQRFPEYVENNKIDLLFASYRYGFLKLYPQYKERFRWLPCHVYKPVFHNKYDVNKEIDYLMMGNTRADLYPLRDRMLRKMNDVEGFLYHAHPGYVYLSAIQELMTYTGERYAREIARAKIFLTCGSSYDYPLAKYFEVPACGTLLLASGFPELRDLGFKNKKTFVEINHRNFKEKAEYYLKHEEERENIIKRAYKLIQSRHTTDIRVRQFVDMIRQFL